MAASTSQLQQSGATNSHLVVLAEKELVAEGVKAFEDFDKRANDLDYALRVLRSSVQLLGFSAQVLHEIYSLRKGIMRLQFHLRENASSLYGESRVKRSESRHVHDVKPDMQPNKSASKSSNTNLKEPETILDGMKRVDESIRNFLTQVNEISQFMDERLNRAFLSFADDLKYRAKALEVYRHQLNSRSFKERINKLATGFSQHLDKMHNALKEFQETSMPAIQGAQQHKGGRLQVLSAVATFFSGVTASTIQYRVNETSTLQDAVNGLWIMSLACSIACAISAQIAYHWRTSRFSASPKSTPVIMAVWLKLSPLFYLCCSVTTFMIGLSVFTFSSNQPTAIFTTVTIFSTTVLVQLITYAAWYGWERENYSKSKGQQGSFRHLADRFGTLYAPYNLVTELALILFTLRRIPHSRAPEADNEAGQERSIDFQITEKTNRASTEKRHLSPRMRAIVYKIIQLDRAERIRLLEARCQPQPRLTRHSSYLSYIDKQATLSLQLFAVVGQHNGLIKHLAFSQDSKYLATCGWDGTATISSVDRDENGNIAIKRIRELRHAGTQLPESSVGPSYLRMFSITPDNLIRGVAWSPTNLKLATRTRETVRIWGVKDSTFDRLLKFTSDNPEYTYSIEAIGWVLEKNTDNEYIVSIEHVFGPGDVAARPVISTRVIKHPISESKPQTGLANPLVKAKYINAVKVTNMALIDDSTFVAVGSCVVDTGPEDPSKTEKILIYFNFSSGSVISMAPLSGEVRSVDITHPKKNIWLILLTYKREKSFPELWEINTGDKHREFHLIRSYFTKSSCEFSGRGCFGGHEDIYVCCSSEEGEIFIWNRDTGLLLHTVQPDNDEHIKFFTCNKRAYPDFLCASGAVDGTLSIWGCSNQISISPMAAYSDGMLTSTPRAMTLPASIITRENSILTGLDVET